MKTALLALATTLVLIPGAAALAEKVESPSITIRGNDEHTRWAERWDTRDVDFAITTEDGGVSLLIVDGVVAMQLSDRTMKKVDRKLDKKSDDAEEEDNALGRAIKSAVLSGVRSMLDRSLECRVRDLRTVEYRGGRLVMIARDGERVFENVEVDDRNVLESFSARDARAFVSEFRRAKHRQRS